VIGASNQPKTRVVKRCSSPRFLFQRHTAVSYSGSICHTVLDSLRGFRGTSGYDIYASPGHFANDDGFATGDRSYGVSKHCLQADTCSGARYLAPTLYMTGACSAKPIRRRRLRCRHPCPRRGILERQDALSVYHRIFARLRCIDISFVQRY
jgi:hypothetical protein